MMYFFYYNGLFRTLQTGCIFNCILFKPRRNFFLLRSPHLYLKNNSEKCKLGICSSTEKLTFERLLLRVRMAKLLNLGVDQA